MGRCMKRTRKLLFIVLLVFAGLTAEAQTGQWQPLDDEVVSLYEQALYDRAATVANKALQVAEGRASLQTLVGDRGEGIRPESSGCGDRP